MGCGRNLLVSVLTGAVFLGGCGVVYNDQIRVPGTGVVKVDLGGKNLRAYRNMFSNTSNGSHILEVREAGEKIVYVGSGPSLNPSLDFVENPRRRNISYFKGEERERIEEEYRKYMKVILEYERD